MTLPLKVTDVVEVGEASEVSSVSVLTSSMLKSSKLSSDASCSSSKNAVGDSPSFDLFRCLELLLNMLLSVYLASLRNPPVGGGVRGYDSTEGVVERSIDEYMVYSRPCWILLMLLTDGGGDLASSRWTK